MTGVEVHDSDEHGVPSDADRTWRHNDLQRWVQHAIDIQNQNTDLVLTGQSPIGELLAVPEATQLDLAVCLIDVRDDIRSDRLERRQPGMWSAEVKQAFNNWARWHRGHADDPAYQPDVIITDDSASFMQWERWRTWERQDPRWAVTTIDSSERAITDTACSLRTWVQENRSRRSDNLLPLKRGWCH